MSLDDALLSDRSLNVILSGEVPVSNASLVGLRFSVDQPTNLSRLLNIVSFSNLTVDEGLYESSADEPKGFAVDSRNTLSVVFYGDANLDGRFHSSDLLQVLEPGKHQDDIAGNSHWTEGD
ncbi:MAG: hypothetical protein GY768_16200 [Planctomycetaceae bacterium]|nr:hypothetical protein [Planctomycetaceae bacterium]